MSVFTVLDNDKEARSAITKAMERGLLETRDYLLISAPDVELSTLESIVKPSVLAEVLSEFTGTSVKPSALSDTANLPQAIHTALTKAGKSGSKQEVASVKTLIAERAKVPANLTPEGIDFVARLAQSIETRVN